MKFKYPNGKVVEATSIDFSTNKEEWNEYSLEDGSVLKFKSIISSIIRTDEFDPTTGDPIYHVRSTNIVSIIVPEEIKKQAEKRVEGMEVG